MKKLLVYLILLSFWIVSLSSLVIANTSENVTQLAPVVITATRTPIKLSEVTSSVIVINRKQIENSSATTVGELLAEQSIGHIQMYPGALTTVSIRGLSADHMGDILRSHILVLLNGRPAGTANLAEIDLKNVERIEIIRGPASVQYGSSAMGGIINIITRKGYGKPKLEINGKLGSYDFEEGTISSYGKYKRLDYSISTTSESQDDYITAKNKKYRNTAYNGKNYFSTNIGYEFLPHNYIRWIFNNFYGDKIGNPSYINNPNLTAYSNKKFWTGDLIYIGSKGFFSWMARYFWGRKYNNYNDPSWNYIYKNSIDQKGVQTQISFNIPYMLLTTGVDFVHYNIKKTSAPYKSKYSNPSYFILATGRLLNNKFILSGGLRWDKYRVKIKNDTGYNSKTKYHVCIRSGIAYLFDNNIKLRFNYGQAFLMPDAMELAANFTSSWGTKYIGNPSLKPEESQTYECGINFNNKYINSDVTYFLTDFKNKIQTTYTTYGKTWINAGKATIQGLELYLTSHIYNPFNISLNINPYINLVYLTQYQDRETDTALLYVPKISLSYGFYLNTYNGLSTNINFAYTGKEKVQDWPSGLYPVPIVEKGGFTVVNLTITKQIMKSNRLGNLYIRGEVKNLFNKYYEYVLGYPMPGRSIYLGLKWVW